VIARRLRIYYACFNSLFRCVSLAKSNLLFLRRLLSRLPGVAANAATVWTNLGALSLTHSAGRQVAVRAARITIFMVDRAGGMLATRWWAAAARRAGDSAHLAATAEAVTPQGASDATS